jgi:hypothetical protein
MKTFKNQKHTNNNKNTQIRGKKKTTKQQENLKDSLKG